MGLADDLRKSVLQAAIQGKLVPQDPKDEPASVLLDRIKAEKEKLIKEKKIKKEKPLEPIKEDEIPFDIPDNWVWTKLIDITSKIGSGSTPQGGKAVYVSDGIKLIREQNVHNYKLKLDNVAYITEEMNNHKPGSVVRAKDLLLNITGGSIGRCALVPDDFDIANINQHILIIRCIEERIRSYLHFCILSPYIQKIIMEKQVGAKEGLSAEKTKNFVIPLPSFSEQMRIADKVEELMARIDQFETIEKELESIKKSFPEDLKKSLLQAAIQGKLTEQLSTDSYVDELLENIKKEKQQLIKDKKIKKEKDLPPISYDEILFDIPESWRWVRLRDIVFNWGQKTPDSDFCYIDVSSIDNRRNRLGDGETILSPLEAPSRARKIIKYGDVIYSTVRPYLHNVCIIDRNFSKEPIVSTAFAVMHTFEGILNSYLFTYLLSPAFDTYANNSENSKGVAYPAINDERLYNAPVPIPPIEEQYRIVEKLDRLLRCCEGLGQ